MSRAIGRFVVYGLFFWFLARGAIVIRPVAMAEALASLLAGFARPAPVETPRASPSSPYIYVSADDGRPLEERGEGDLIGEGERDERSESRIALPAFDDAEMLRMDPSALRGQLLREPLFFSDAAESQAQTLPRTLDGALDRGARPHLGGAVRSIGR